MVKKLALAVGVGISLCTLVGTASAERKSFTDGGCSYTYNIEGVDVTNISYSCGNSIKIYSKDGKTVDNLCCNDVCIGNDYSGFSKIRSEKCNPGIINYVRDTIILHEIKELFDEFKRMKENEKNKSPENGSRYISFLNQ